IPARTRKRDWDTGMITTHSTEGNFAAWMANAHRLARWTEERLVNRRDVYGAYRPGHEIGREYTRADGGKGTPGEHLTVKRTLTPAVLARHFWSVDRCAIIGLHAASADNLSLWGAVDIDHHGPTSTAPEANRDAALWWYGRLVRKGFHPLLTESNGRGG